MLQFVITCDDQHVSDEELLAAGEAVRQALVDRGVTTQAALRRCCDAFIVDLQEIHGITSDDAVIWQRALEAGEREIGGVAIDIELPT